MKTLKIRNKNAILESLQNGVNFDRISIVGGLEQDSLTKKIVSVAKERRVPIESKPIRKMVNRRSGHTKEVLVGFVVMEDVWPLKDLIDHLYKKDKDPFFLLINRVNFESNIGVIARTALAVGVNGLILQGDEDRFINEETLHYSVGAIARVPLVKAGIFEALKELKKNGIKTYCLQIEGETYYKEDLTGPVAFVLGAEGKGVSEEIAKRCDKKLAIPMSRGVDSLNVGVSAGVVLYEKLRQDG